MSHTDIPSGEQRAVKTCPVCQGGRIYYFFQAAATGWFVATIGEIHGLIQDADLEYA